MILSFYISFATFCFFTVLDKPISPIVNNVTESSINISWTPFLGGGANNITGYLVSVAPNEGDPSNVQETTATISGLTSNTEYTVSVTAMGSDGRNGATSMTPAITSTIIIDKICYVLVFNVVVCL